MSEIASQSNTGLPLEYRILISTPSISMHDAVSNDIIKQSIALRRAGFAVAVYAELFDERLRHLLVSRSEVEWLIRDSRVVWIYHHSVYWELGDRLLEQARCVRILRYHNITPAKFFRDFGEDGAAYATEQGILQTSRFGKSGRFPFVLGASEYNCADLKSAGFQAEVFSSVAPFHFLDDFNGCELSPTLRREDFAERIDVLFVGRVVPNKGHIHLLHVIDELASRTNKQVKLHILGSMACTPHAYGKMLMQMVSDLRLAEFVEFYGSRDFNFLYSLYKMCDVFLLMSEHEGFCVPIVEAQRLGIPVVALDRCANVETLGQGQIHNKNLDYPWFASAVDLLSSDKELRSNLIKKGSENLKRFSSERLSQELFAFIQASVDNIRHGT